MKVCSRCSTQRPIKQFNWSIEGVRRASECAFCQRARNNRRNRFMRLLVLKHYGGDPPRCACCGEAFAEFLSLDHIAGGGRQHRKTIATRWWEWIIRNKFPDTFRVLCHNCNQAIGVYGYCPHQNGTGQEIWATAYDPNAPNRGHKLSLDAVEQIRKRIASGETQISLALEFKVSRATICLVNQGKRWGDGPTS
jgi:hypothetical protein